LETLEDFLTPPIYEGRGRWAKIMDVLRDIKQQSLSGILLLQSGGMRVYNFLDYGTHQGSLLFEEGSMFAYPEDEFFRERSGMKHIRPFRYRFSPLNSDVVMVVSSFHRSSVVMDTIIPYPERVINELSSLEFSGILRSYSPTSFSAVFLEGMIVGVFSKGATFNLNDLISVEGALYEFKVFSVKEQLFERSYEQLFKQLYDKFRHLYKQIARGIPDFYLKVREAMVSESHTDPVLDPIIGLVEPMEGDILFHVSKRKGIYVIESFLELISGVIREESSLQPTMLRKFLEDIERLKREIREGL